jgi:outer membrane autotransporter protein
LAAAAALAAPAVAQTNLASLTFANAIEQGAATSNDTVFRTLDPQCNPGGVLNTLPQPVYADLTGRADGSVAGPLCTEDAFFVYTVARELVQTANELAGAGPTAGSLGVDLEGLGLALRWTAAEELAAQGSMATQFANSQLSSLAARMTALRFGATGLAGANGAAGLYNWGRGTSSLLAQNGAAATGSTSGESYSPWGGFINYGFGFGNKEPTALEDAFDFDGSEITLGGDYRLRNGLVLGAILGLSKQNIDFDEAASDISVVDGDIDSDGTSFIVFALWQKGDLSISGSLGTQSLDYDIERNIKYPSFNPDVSSIYSVANSSPDADVLTTTFDVGYAFHFDKLTVEPFFSLERLDVTVDSFAESRSVNLLSNSSINRRFDLVVSEQDIESLQTALGVRLQYVVTPRFGVVVPYLTLAARNESEDSPRTITAGYAALASVLGSNTFALPTDAPDGSYSTVSVGSSIVLRGGRQRRAGGPIAGGVSGFVQFATVQGRRSYDDSVFAAGFRYEF